MRSMSSLGLVLNLTIGAAFVGHMTLEARAGNEAHRIVSVGGSITEIVYTLGQGDRLVARDSTSIYPAEANELANVGYARALSPEGVLSVDPDMILATAGAGPDTTLDVLKQADIAYVEVPEIFTADGAVTKLEVVAEALGQGDIAAPMIDQMRSDLTVATDRATKAAGGDPVRVLFVMSTVGGRITAAGSNTAADGVIKLAGGVNVVDTFEGYKQMTDEAISALAPDVILAMNRGGDHGVDMDKLALPALITTPAAQNKRLVTMGGMKLLGFGPRLPEVVTELTDAFYGDRIEK